MRIIQPKCAFTGFWTHNVSCKSETLMFAQFVCGRQWNMWISAKVIMLSNEAQTFGVSKVHNFITCSFSVPNLSAFHVFSALIERRKVGKSKAQFAFRVISFTVSAAVLRLFEVESTTRIYSKGGIETGRSLLRPL